MQMLQLSLILLCTFFVKAMEENVNHGTKRPWIDINTSNGFYIDEQSQNEEVKITAIYVNESYKQAQNYLLQGHGYLYGKNGLPQDTEKAFQLLLKATQQNDNFFAQRFAQLLISEISFQKARTIQDKQEKETILTEIQKIIQKILKTELPDEYIAKTKLLICHVMIEKHDIGIALQYAHEIANQDKDLQSKIRAIKILNAYAVNAHVLPPSYNCNKCTEEFLSSSELKYHKKTHNNISCPICKNLFSCVSNRNTHMRGIHNIEPYETDGESD